VFGCSILSGGKRSDPRKCGSYTSEKSAEGGGSSKGSTEGPHVLRNAPLKVIKTGVPHSRTYPGIRQGFGHLNIREKFPW